MVDQNIIKDLSLDENEVLSLVDAAIAETAEISNLDDLMGDQETEFKPGSILQGTIVGRAGDSVVVDVGFKSEGLIDKHEFDDIEAATPGASIEVLLEGLEASEGVIQLSKRKADRIRGWERVITEKSEGDLVEGMVKRKIKGGLLVDIGVPVFLPASQVDVRRPHDIGEYMNRPIRAKILKIDTERRNIVISRRKLIEEERAEAREKLLGTIEEGQIIKGQVKNIADFGAFVDLGGIDGLLHITDMSWGRVNHPSELLKIDEEVEIKVLNIDRDKEKVALGLKQLQSSPWENIADTFPISSRVRGEVVNIVSYGAFVKLTDGIEGLVHISEMSWTRRISHPSEMVSIGEEVDVVVLDINKDKQEISLGMKQTEVNPWELVAEKYPPGTVVEGKVRNLANYGAFIEIEPGIDGMLHVSDLSWTKKIAHPNEMLKKGESIKCIVLEVDQDKQRVSLGLKQLTEDPWVEAIPTHYQPGMIVQGHVTKITNFGVFVELEDDLEGLLHISELADHKVENPQDVVKPNQDIEVKILRVDVEERKIGLSLKRAQTGADMAEYEAERSSRESRGDGAGGPTRGGMDDSAGLLGTDKISFGPGGVQSTAAQDGASESEPPQEAPAEEAAAEEPAAEEPKADDTGAEEPKA